MPDDNHHYTCLNESGECSELSYVYYSSEGLPYYINLTEGKGIDDALNDMLNNDNVNKTDSTIKKAIDTWYSNNMTEYTSYLEDTVWCNDRSIFDKGGWDQLNGNLTSILYFNSYKKLTNLICTNKNDRFTVNSTNGNGALTYPVGLITRQEQNLAYSSSKSPLASRHDYWGLSPSSFSINSTNVYSVDLNGYESSYSVHNTLGVRPAISLREGAEYSSGDGSSDYPYLIDIST